ncbi:MAG TPA: hypothetical protein HA367_01350 [Candidatus Methanofastidiosum sp.]|nr:hypothetical protein [Methanofastidiosum sp.]
MNGKEFKKQLKAFEGFKKQGKTFSFLNNIAFTGNEMVRTDSRSMVVVPFVFADKFEVNFYELKKAIPNDHFVIYTEGNKLMVSSSERNVALDITRDGSPEIPLVNNMPSVEFNLKDFQESYEKVKSIPPKKVDFNVVFTAVNFTKDEMAATDGQRLMTMKSTIPFDVILSMEHLNVINKLPNAKTISQVGKWIVIEGEGFTSYHESFVGVFPDYQRIIPQEVLPFVTLPVKPLINALSPMKSFARIKCDGESLVVEELNRDRGEEIVSSSKMDLYIRTQPMSFVIEPQQLLDGLNPLKEQFVKIENQGEARPIIFKEDDYLYLQVTYSEVL